MAWFMANDHDRDHNLSGWKFQLFEITSNITVKIEFSFNLLHPFGYGHNSWFLDSNLLNDILII